MFTLSVRDKGPKFKKADESERPLVAFGHPLVYEANADALGAMTSVTGPALFTAFQEQAGLKLEATRGSVEVLVIDHAEKPSAN